MDGSPGRQRRPPYKRYRYFEDFRHDSDQDRSGRRFSRGDVNHSYTRRGYRSRGRNFNNYSRDSHNYRYDRNLRNRVEYRDADAIPKRPQDNHSRQSFYTHSTSYDSMDNMNESGLPKTLRPQDKPCKKSSFTSVVGSMDKRNEITKKSLSQVNAAKKPTVTSVDDSKSKQPENAIPKVSHSQEKAAKKPSFTNFANSMAERDKRNESMNELDDGEIEDDDEEFSNPPVLRCLMGSSLIGQNTQNSSDNLTSKRASIAKDCATLMAEKDKRNEEAGMINMPHVAVRSSRRPPQLTVDKVQEVTTTMPSTQNNVIGDPISTISAMSSRKRNRKDSSSSSSSSSPERVVDRNNVDSHEYTSRRGRGRGRGYSSRPYVRRGTRGGRMVSESDRRGPYLGLPVTPEYSQKLPRRRCRRRSYSVTCSSCEEGEVTSETRTPSSDRSYETRSIDSSPGVLVSVPMNQFSCSTPTRNTMLTPPYLNESRSGSRSRASSPHTDSFSSSRSRPSSPPVYPILYPPYDRSSIYGEQGFHSANTSGSRSRQSSPPSNHDSVSTFNTPSRSCASSPRSDNSTLFNPTSYYLTQLLNQSQVTNPHQPSQPRSIYSLVPRPPLPKSSSHGNLIQPTSRSPSPEPVPRLVIAELEDKERQNWPSTSQMEVENPTNNDLQILEPYSTTLPSDPLPILSERLFTNPNGRRKQGPNLHGRREREPFRSSTHVRTPVSRRSQGPVSTQRASRLSRPANPPTTRRNIPGRGRINNNNVNNNNNNNNTLSVVPVRPIQNQCLSPLSELEIRVEEMFLLLSKEKPTSKMYMDLFELEKSYHRQMVISGRPPRHYRFQDIFQQAIAEFGHKHSICLAYLDFLGRKSPGSEELDRKWKEIVAKFPKDPDMWNRYIDSVMFTTEQGNRTVAISAAFDFCEHWLGEQFMAQDESVIGCYGRILSMLFVRRLKWMIEMGFTEKVIGSLKLSSELRVFSLAYLKESPAHICKTIRQFWESSVPMMGDNDFDGGFRRHKKFFANRTNLPEMYMKTDENSRGIVAKIPLMLPKSEEPQIRVTDWVDQELEASEAMVNPIRINEDFIVRSPDSPSVMFCDLAVIPYGANLEDSLSALGAIGFRKGTNDSFHDVCLDFGFPTQPPYAYYNILEEVSKCLWNLASTRDSAFFYHAAVCTHIRSQRQLPKCEKVLEFNEYMNNSSAVTTLFGPEVRVLTELLFKYQFLKENVESIGVVYLEDFITRLKNIIEEMGGIMDIPYLLAQIFFSAIVDYISATIHTVDRDTIHELIIKWIDGPVEGIGRLEVANTRWKLSYFLDNEVFTNRTGKDFERFLDTPNSLIHAILIYYDYSFMRDVENVWYPHTNETILGVFAMKKTNNFTLPRCKAFLQCLKDYFMKNSAMSKEYLELLYLFILNFSTSPYGYRCMLDRQAMLVTPDDLEEFWKNVLEANKHPSTASCVTLAKLKLALMGLPDKKENLAIIIECIEVLKDPFVGQIVLESDRLSTEQMKEISKVALQYGWYSKYLNLTVMEQTKDPAVLIDLRNQMRTNAVRILTETNVDT